MSANKLFGKDIIITSTTNASGTSIGSISTLGGVNINQTALISGALTSIANSNTVGNLFTTGGNVGVGTTAPVQRLDVNGNLNFTGNLYQNGSVYSGSTQWGSTGANIYFNTGNVGIGTIFPSTKLHLKDAGSVTLLLEADHDNVNESDVATIQLRQDGGLTGMDIGIDNTNSSYIKFNTGTTKGNDFTIYDDNTARMFINSSGNMGIGTTSPNPAYKLDVNGSLRSTGDIFVGNGIGAEALNLWDIPGAAWQLATGDHKLNIRNGTVGSTMVDRVTIASTGNVGIGTISPGYTLDVRTTASSAYTYTGNFIAPNITAGQQSGIVIGKANSGNNVCEIRHFHAGDGSNQNMLRIGSSGLDNIMSIRYDGNVGIGTTSPSSTLHAIGKTILGINTPTTTDISDTLYIQGTGGNYTQIHQYLHTTSGNLDAYISLNRPGPASGNMVGNTNTGGSFNIWTNSNHPVAIGTNATQRMIINTSGNVGIGTNVPAYPLDIIHTVNSSNQPFMRIGNSSGGAGNQVGIILSPLSTRTGGASSQIISIDDGNASAHLTLWTAPGGGTTASVERVRIQNNGNVGIGTASPAFTLDVNGTIARSGVKLPRYDNGSFSGSASFSIPILFNDTQYNYAEFRVRYVTSAICNMNISATNYVNAAMNLGECALTTVKWNAQGTPVYATFSAVTSGIFADTVEMVGIDNNLIFRIVRATGTNTTGLRNHYSYDNVYCWSGIGTARGYGQGHIDNASVGGSPLQFVTFTCSTGTVSGTYSTVHYY